jgi:hypothetical protein
VTLPLLAVVLSAALVAAPAPAATARLAARAHIAAVTLTKVAVDGSTVTVAGRVRLPVNSARERRRALVWLTLTSVADTVKQSETFAAKLDTKDRFLVAHTTTLSGALGLGVLVKIGGRASGKRTFDTVDVAPSARSGSSTTTASGSPSSGSTTSGSSSAGSSPSGPESPTQPSDLDGTFGLEPATDVDGAIGGSWFEMLTPENPPKPIENNNSPLSNKDFTPLSTGAAGGLQTFAYAPAPSPAFSKTGNALANAIMQPENFVGDDFSVVTQASDPQTGEADPLPQIVDTNGQLSGQITAWAVGWNDQWFNQGSPKPNGTLPGPSTALTGTYDVATGHYTLEWKSEIVGGPFNSQDGSWHLEGTFVPAG